MMQFAALATLFAAALAAPAPQTTDCPNPAHCGGSPPDPSTYDNVDISNLFVRKNPDVKSFDFDIKGANGTARCEASNFDKLPQIVVCGDSNYRAGLTELTEEGQAKISVYRQTAPAFGMSGDGTVPVYCHAGGDGPDDFVCQQVNAATIVIEFP